MPRCGCSTLAGTQCKRNATTGSKYCAQHKACSKPHTAKQPAAKRPAAKRPAAKRPAAKRPTGKRPAAKRPTASPKATCNVVYRYDEDDKLRIKAAVKGDESDLIRFNYYVKYENGPTVKGLFSVKLSRGSASLEDLLAYLAVMYNAPPGCTYISGVSSIDELHDYFTLVIGETPKPKSSNVKYAGKR